jgi:hypothetical protein
LHETGKKLLNLMFRPGERVCVSHNKYGYHSIPLESAFKDKVTLVPTPESCEKRGLAFDEDAYEKVNGEQLLLVALNPMKDGYRDDENCSAFRNFLVEMDGLGLQEQINYIKAVKMPYSAIIFSGNKSLHFLVSLSEDLPSEKVYRIFSEWILAIANLADQKTKNPSRSIRIPGGMREEGKQILVDFKGPVDIKDLAAWLNTHPEAKPEPPQKRRVSTNPDFNGVAEWAVDLLLNGIDESKGRNNQWYSIAYEFALSGYSEDDTIEVLGGFFTPERSFKEREWIITIKSAFKHAYSEPYED